ncbi:MAG: LAGLIDADG family homing endonuclease, partial [Methanofastidiosum sp.]
RVLTIKINGQYYFKWTSDMETWQQEDYWATPPQFVIEKKGKGDCLEENTEIIVKDGIKKIKDLKEGDLVLSYNYNLEQYEYKPVTKIWDKGILDGYDIKLKNGHNIIATGEHRFFCRISEDYPNKYEIKKFKDIELDKWHKHQLHCVYRLPEGNIDIDKNWAYLCGIYIAEGWFEKSHVCIAQDKSEIREKIEEALHNLHIPYSKSKRTKNAYYNILNPEYKVKFKELGNNSFNKQFPNDVLNWNNESLKYLIEGLLDGDGTDCTNYKNNFADGSKRNNLWEFSTSSEQIAKIFNIIVRKVYGNIYYYKQLHHQGVGKQPIWRLRFNPTALSNRREIFNGISTVSIAKSKVREVKDKHYYDIEVEDNHNFVLADSGVISHNCDEHSGLHCDYLYRLCKLWLVKWLEIYWKKRYWNSVSNSYQWKNLGHAITIFKETPESPWKCFSNQQFLGMTNGYQGIGEIVSKFCPKDDNHELIKVVARHPITGDLLWVIDKNHGGDELLLTIEQLKDRKEIV